MQDEFELFRAEMKGIKPIKQDTFVAPRQKSGQKKSNLRDIREKEDTLFYFPMNMNRYSMKMTGS
ncbi:Smr protein/MutS2 C-terminal family protein [Rodentibacter pneumotropicus]|uniref:Smr protein/MutS2 C-terminal family protein n=1 Tax=Rodentibacter pneumotropicus TaxID=758 RepID=A0A448MPB5_9PAST|nr:Smr protein/MutS2 C-terminal family protein [Rodentibacter pneumotropicus]